MSPRSNLAIRALGLLALSATAGCSLFNPPDLERLEADNRAVIEGKYVALKLGVSKITVRPMHEPDAAKPLVGYPGTVEIAAGPQRLFANVCGPSSALLSCRSAALLEFDAEAGHAYKVDGNLNEELWIVDAETGAIVARSRPYAEAQQPPDS